jgi:hypothetical protein
MLAKHDGRQTVRRLLKTARFLGYLAWPGLESRIRYEYHPIRQHKASDAQEWASGVAQALSKAGTRISPESIRRFSELSHPASQLLSALSLASQADRHFERREFPAALKLYREALRDYPAWCVVKRLSQLERQRGRPSRACLLLRDAADRKSYPLNDADLAECLVQLAEWHRRRSQAVADQTLLEALERCPAEELAKHLTIDDAVRVYRGVPNPKLASLAYELARRRDHALYRQSDDSVPVLRRILARLDRADTLLRNAWRSDARNVVVDRVTG